MPIEESNEIQIGMMGKDGKVLPLEKGVYTNLNVEVLPDEIQHPVKGLIDTLSESYEFTVDLDDESAERLKKFMESQSDPTPKEIRDAFMNLQDILAKHGYAIFAIFRKVIETKEENERR